MKSINPSEGNMEPTPDDTLDQKMLDTRPPQTEDWYQQELLGQTVEPTEYREMLSALGTELSESDAELQAGEENGRYLQMLQDKLDSGMTYQQIYEEQEEARRSMDELSNPESWA